MKRFKLVRHPTVLVLFLMVGTIIILQASPGGIAQQGPWFTVRKYCLLALLGITWALIAFCVLSGAGICVRLARRVFGARADEIAPDTPDDTPATEIK